MSRRRRILAFVVSMLLATGSGLVVYREGPSFESLGGLLFFAGCSLFLLFEPRLERRPRRIAAERLCRVGEMGFEFRHGYYFRHGCMKRRKLLPYTEVSALWATCFPPAALVGQELVLLLGLEQAQCEAIALERRIPMVAPRDIWALLAEEYLDTEIDEIDKARTLKALEEEGFSVGEVALIRKRIGWRMLWINSYVWEWVHLGHYDVLKALQPMSERTYRWTMDIALRPLQGMAGSFRAGSNVHNPVGSVTFAHDMR